MIRHFFFGLLVTTAIAAMIPQESSAQDISFAEKFALAEDRAAVLRELVPGTDEYYHYHCMHYQNTQQFDKAQQMIEAWSKRRRGMPHEILQMSHRQALLTYSDKPDQTVAYIKDKLRPNLNHQRRRPTAEPGLPTRLDQQVISFERLNERALRRSNTGEYESVALAIAASQKLSKSQLRHLLERLDHPNIVNLAKLVHQDLSEKDSSGFGTLAAHNVMTMKQLDELLKLRPRLAVNQNFINAKILRLQSSNDVHWKYDTKEYVAYLDRLWNYVSDLAPAYNSMKASVLYRRLELDRKLGVYDKQRFMTYLKLPRQCSYIHPRMLKDIRGNEVASLAANYQPVTRLAPINSDEALVRDYLHHFLEDASDFKAFEDLVQSEYLKQRFAESKITAGLGDVEQWASSLSPTAYQELLKRVDLDFAHTNLVDFKVDQSVEIKLVTKNVKNLIVKIFEINTPNFYRNQDREINTDINLDGLVPNWQRQFDYDESPALRVDRSFKFDELDHRGVYIIDFIGNGKSSRVLVRKGQLTTLVETTVVGQRLTVYNENREQVKDATLWISGRKYQPDDKGRILVPFSTRPGRQQIVIQHNGFAARDSFQHAAENYQLNAGFYVDRESLVRGRKASVIIRPQLRVAGTHAPLKMLKEVVLTIRATNIDGIESTREFKDLKLAEEHETEVEFMIPARLRMVQFELNARIQNSSRQEKQSLVAYQQFMVNEMDQSQALQVAHLRQNETGYHLAIRGKTGEARPSQAVQVQLKHRMFTDKVVTSLQSDKQGQVDLGPLLDIESIEVDLSGTQTQSWNLVSEHETNYQSINAASDQAIQIPCGPNQRKDDLYLLELRGDANYADASEHVSVSDGLITISALAVGDYRLRNSATGLVQTIRVTAGPINNNYVAGPWRTLEIRTSDPLHVKEIETATDKLRIHVGGNTKFARVHVLASRFQPKFNAFAELGKIGDIEPTRMTRAYLPSGYMAGRTLGEEYQYILNRQLQEKFPGNMLTRPSLLLNPWALRTTENNVQVALEGGVFGAADAGSASSDRKRKGASTQQQTNSDYASLDFLGDGSVVLANLLPNEDGIVEIDLDLFEQKHMLQIVVQDHLRTITRNTLLPEVALEFRDLRLADGFDPEGHFAQQKQYTVLKAGAEFELDDQASARFQQYDDLADVYRYFVTVTGNSNLIQFGFLMEWPNKSDDEKLELYKRHACHELNFFLMKKDPEYFAAVIQPYLQNKFDRTFLDEFLLEQDLGSWVQPWEFERLNTVEQILLGRRVDDNRQRLDQLIGDDYDNNPTSRRHFDRLYEFAVASGWLDGDDDAKNEEDGEAGPGGGRPGRDKQNRYKEAELSDEMQRVQPTESSRAGGLPPVANAAPMNLGQKADDAPRQSATRRSRDLRKQSLARADDKSVSKKGMKAAPSGGGGGGARERGEVFESLDRLVEQQKNVEQFYRRLKPTQEWVENNYYNLPIEQQNHELVRVNRFWRDFALHTGNEPFLSPYFPESARNFTEMMLALAVIDLPFENPEHELEYVDDKMKLVPRNNLIAFYEQVKPATFDRGESSILVSENFFRVDDRYRIVEGKTRENFIRKEFLANVLYGGQVVITNPTSTPQEIDLLLQIPVGSLPASSSSETKTTQMDLTAFSTQTVEYFFYFPTAGDFGHFPAHASVENAIVSVADGLRFNVVDEATEIDKESWAWISQNGSEKQVIEYLDTQNLQSIDLSLIAFRMKNAEFFKTATELLTKRFAFDSTLWAYSILHKDAKEIHQFLKHQDEFVGQCGIWLQSELLEIEPVIRRQYQHREYWPLVNARVHQLGKSRKILNNAIWQQYQQLLDIVSRQPKPEPEERLAITSYLLLQDRIGEAIKQFETLNVDQFGENSDPRLQYDYCAAYIAMYQSRPEDADKIAKRYVDYPVKRWRELFAAVSSQVSEINGGASEIVDSESQSQRQAKAAAETPNFEFVVEDRKTRLKYQNISEVSINYYQMDVELLFSRNPFVKKQDEGFAMIQPNFSQTVKLEAGDTTKVVELPEQFRTSNVLVEVTGAGKTERQAYYANSMTVQVIDQFGQLKVTHSDSDELLPKVYVKVYAQKADGSVHYYKDGYTDLRGRFDYASLSNQNLDDVQRFSILVISPDHGAIVREAKVPKE